MVAKITCAEDWDKVEEEMLWSIHNIKDDGAFFELNSVLYNISMKAKRISKQQVTVRQTKSRRKLDEMLISINDDIELLETLIVTGILKY
jgi:hypothetical protein